ncbi:MAG TPA: Holliday junction branch migration protein RuvA [Actinomycetota bacterium]
MIAFLEGVVAEKAGDRVVVAVGGTGYEVLVPALTLAKLPPPGRTVRLFTRLQVRDDAMVLYGFSSAEERSLFDLLITVSGVGPKMALAVLSILTPDSLRRAVASGDGQVLTLVPGVGKKVAARVLLDLKDRIGLGGEASVSGPLAEVREALLALGLSAQEARDALTELGPDGERPVEELLRDALRSVGR